MVPTNVRAQTGTIGTPKPPMERETYATITAVRSPLTIHDQVHNTYALIRVSCSAYEYTAVQFLLPKTLLGTSTERLATRNMIEVSESKKARTISI